MGLSLNKIQLIGNLGKDAENRFTPNNMKVTSFSLATTNSYKGKDGQWVNDTTWHDIVGFNLADFFVDALKKGASFYVEGRLQKRSYDDKDGVKRYVTEVIAEKLIPLDSNSKPSEVVAAYQAAPVDNGPEDDDLPF